MLRQNKEVGPFVALRILSKKGGAGTVLQSVWGEILGITCKYQLHTCYFNSKGNYTKVNGFERIYTLPAGRRTWPRRDREGRDQLGWATQDFHVLTLGSAGLITDRDLCYAARAQGSGPCVLMDTWWRFPLFPELEWSWIWGIAALSLQQRFDTTPPKSPWDISSVLLEDL